MIELYRLRKEVPSGAETLTILHSLDLTIPEGQFVSIVGPSGSGKSTLLGLVAGLDAPTAGQITIDGAVITSMSEDALAELRGRKIGIVFQSFHLIASLTAYENVLVPMEIAGLKDAQERAHQLLADVDLTARAHHYPSQLSGGEQQRVSIARAFSNNPSILLADEPTGNLDSANGRHVFDLMLKLNRQRGTTLILITHDHELAALADRRIALRDGRVVSDSSGSGAGEASEMSETGATGKMSRTGVTFEASEAGKTGEGKTERGTTDGGGDVGAGGAAGAEVSEAAAEGQRPR